MEMIKFIISNLDNIVALGGIIALIFITLKKGKKEELISVIISLMMESEYIYGSGTGLLKKEDVLNKIPAIFKLLYSKEKIKSIIDNSAFEYKSMFDKINQNS